MACAIRQATIHDLDQLVPLFDSYRQFYSKPSDLTLARTFLTERFQHNQSVIFIALNSEGNGIGFVQLYPSFSSVRAARTFVLNDLFVAPDWRRHRVARQLMQAAVDYSRAVGAVRMSLSTALTNTAAQALYESCGWQRDQTFCEYQLTLKS